MFYTALAEMPYFEQFHSNKNKIVIDLGFFE